MGGSLPDLTSLQELFVAEAEERLAEMEVSLLGLESDPTSSAAIDSVFRCVHTLKGNAAAFGLESISTLADSLEELLDGIRSELIPVTTERVSLMLELVDLFRGKIPLAARGEDALTSVDRDYLSRLEGELGSESVGGSAGGHEPPSSTDRPAPHSIAQAEAGRGGGVRTLRVERTKLDELLDLLGEISVARGRLSAELAGLVGGSAALEIHHEADHLYLALQELVMGVRMVPVGPIFRSNVRVVRDLDLELGKVARVEIAGGEVEVDATIVERLRDPLTQIIRNALDHGIEFPSERVASGKEPEGVISLRARHDAGSVVIEVADDGRGIDLGAIEARAHSLGLLDDSTERSAEELLDLIFEPGFSTASSESSLSGRGVGMDIIRREIDLLRGTVGVSSRRGEGSRFTIRVPLTLAIIDAALVEVGSERYLIPAEFIEEYLELPECEAACSLARGVINVRGKAVPYLRLRDLLELEFGRPDRESIVLVRGEEGPVGLVVDRLLGQHQVVIKPLVRPLQEIPNLVGTTILRDGRVGLILDIPACLNSVGVGQAVSRDVSE